MQTHTSAHTHTHSMLTWSIINQFNGNVYQQQAPRMALSVRLSFQFFDSHRKTLHATGSTKLMTACLEKCRRPFSMAPWVWEWCDDSINLLRALWGNSLFLFYFHKRRLFDYLQKRWCENIISFPREKDFDSVPFLLRMLGVALSESSCCHAGWIKTHVNIAEYRQLQCNTSPVMAVVQLLFTALLLGAGCCFDLLTVT